MLKTLLRILRRALTVCALFYGYGLWHIAIFEGGYTDFDNWIEGILIAVATIATIVAVHWILEDP